MCPFFFSLKQEEEEKTGSEMSLSVQPNGRLQACLHFLAHSCSASLVRCGINGEKGGGGGGAAAAAAEDVKFGFQVILPCDTVCSCDTAKYVCDASGKPGSQENRTAMQISDCEAYAKEVSVSQIPRGSPRSL